MVRRFLLISSSLAWLSGASAASAEPAAEDIAAARALGIQGVKLAEDGKCADAIDKLERAEALYHAPTILGRLGECQVETGKIVEGTENLNRVVREQLAPNAPVAFRNAQDRAKKVLERALPRIAYLTIRVEPKDLPASVTVSSVPVPTALLGAERPTNPGTYQVVVSAQGYHDTSSSVTLAEGSHQEITLRLTPLPAAAPPPAAPPPTPVQAPPAPAAEPHHSNTLSYVLLGVGGVGLITGGITGAIALSKKSSLECPNNKCPPNQHDKLDSAYTMSTISTIGFGVGLAGVAAGTVLLILGSHEPEARVGSLTARPFVSNRALGVVGEF